MNPSEALAWSLQMITYHPCFQIALKPIEPYLKEAKQVLGESQNQKLKTGNRK